MIHWKWRFTRYSPLTRYGHFTCCPTYCISSKPSDTYIKTFSTLSGTRILSWILPLLDILCTSAVNDTMLKRQFTVQVSPVFRALEFIKARETCRRVDQTSIWSISYFGQLCNKNCIIKTSELLTIWSASCYTAGSDMSDTMEGVPDRLLERWWWLGYRVDMLNCWWPTDVYRKWWLSILRELCIRIVRYA